MKTLLLSFLLITTSFANPKKPEDLIGPALSRLVHELVVQYNKKNKTSYSVSEPMENGHIMAIAVHDEKKKGALIAYFRVKKNPKTGKPVSISNSTGSTEMIDAEIEELYTVFNTQRFRMIITAKEKDLDKLIKDTESDSKKALLELEKKIATVVSNDVFLSQKESKSRSVAMQAPSQIDKVYSELIQKTFLIYLLKDLLQVIKLSGSPISIIASTFFDLESSGIPLEKLEELFKI